ncbi:hypothetical protein A6767_01675 [Aeromonas veronii]|nr:hypothetical protein A6767_01675 [Aeromonas veronii]
MQHCSALLSAITPLEARPPDRVAHQVMIPAHRRERLQHCSLLLPSIPHLEGQAAGLGRMANALPRIDATQQLRLGTWLYTGCVHGM